MVDGTGMEKENSASGGGGGGGGAEAAATPGATSTSEKLQADQANPLLDPAALFGEWKPTSMPRAGGGERLRKHIFG
ncbi:hypothetical protein X777_03586 [Ooceraea biroi]|uniref:Uncharacterized protein n=1 Tax=Ooceraea biroi TaxID=2015173 RepID=A0A026WJE2_OOCBI|nr:hypothetical protein X777_03586 [Ooceraea biroi]